MTLLTELKWCGLVSLVFIFCVLLQYAIQPLTPVTYSGKRAISKVDTGSSRYPGNAIVERATPDNAILHNNTDSWVSKYVDLTQNKTKEEVYKDIINKHFLAPSRTATHCSKRKFPVPAPHKYFRIHSDIVNPYSYDTLLSPDPAFCDDTTFALVITLSYHDNYNDRIGIRQTWGNATWLYAEGYTASPVTIKQIFLFGVHKKNELNEAIKVEHGTHGDVLQGSFMESYRTLGFKSRLGLEWVASRCPQARYIIKADDDVIVNMPLLYRELRSRAVSRTMIGHCNDREPVHRKPSSKFYSSCEEFPFDRRPIYMDGPMYVMTSDMAHDLFLAALHMRDYFIDDAYISGFLTIPLNITLQCERGYGVNSKEDQPRMPHEKKFVISAKDPAQMRTIWDVIKNASKTS